MKFVIENGLFPEDLGQEVCNRFNKISFVVSKGEGDTKASPSAASVRFGSGARRLGRTTSLDEFLERFLSFLPKINIPVTPQRIRQTQIGQQHGDEATALIGRVAMDGCLPF